MPLADCLRLITRRTKEIRQEGLVQGCSCRRVRPKCAGRAGTMTVASSKHRGPGSRANRMGRVVFSKTGPVRRHRVQVRRRQIRSIAAKISIT